MTTIQGQITSCASSISQAAGLAALAVSDEEMQVSFDVMRKKVRGKPREMFDLFSHPGPLQPNLSVGQRARCLWVKRGLEGAERGVCLFRFDRVLGLENGKRRDARGFWGGVAHECQRAPRMPSGLFGRRVCSLGFKIWRGELIK